MCCRFIDGEKNRTFISLGDDVTFDCHQLGSKFQSQNTWINQILAHLGKTTDHKFRQFIFQMRAKIWAFFFFFSKKKLTFFFSFIFILSNSEFFVICCLILYSIFYSRFHNWIGNFFRYECFELFFELCFVWRHLTNINPFTNDWSVCDFDYWNFVVSVVDKYHDGQKISWFPFHSIKCAIWILYE